MVLNKPHVFKKAVALRFFQKSRGATAFLFFLLFFQKTEAVFAQNPLADSLSTLLKTTRRDTNRVNWLNDLAWELNESEPERAQNLLLESIGLAQNLGFKKGEAAAWNALGVLEQLRDRPTEAEKNYRKALEIRQLIGDQRGVVSMFNNLGNLAEGRDSFPLALSLFQKSLRVAEQLRDSARMASVQFNIARVHEEMGNYPEANQNAYEFLAMAERSRDRDGMAKAWTMLGNIQFELEDFNRAEDFYQKALKIRQLDGGEADDLAAAFNNLANALDELKRYGEANDFYQKALAIRQKSGNESSVAEVFANLGDLRKHEGKSAEALDFFKKALKIYEKEGDESGKLLCFNGLGDVLRKEGKPREALVFTEKYQAIAQATGDEKYQQKALKDLAETWAALGDFQKAYTMRKAYDELRWKRLSETRAKDFERRDILYGDQKKQFALDQQAADLRVRDADLEKASLRQKGLLGGGAALILLTLLLYNRNRIRKKSNEKLAAQNEIIQQERERSDALLLNILPEKIAAELRETGHARAQRFDDVTVMFTDFKSFTTIAEQLSPEQLVATLDAYFKGFDEITSRHGIEKIKTIGDAYMAAAGLPLAEPRHAHKMVTAALEILDFMYDFNQKQAESLFTTFEVRIGIHSGPVVAGIVGSKKFAWDIWGDAVNMAARMESSGEPGRVNISETTYSLVKNEFRCTPRGRILAKNKGEVEMFFVERLDS